MAVSMSARGVPASSGRRRRMRLRAKVNLSQVARVANMGTAPEEHQLSARELSRMERGLLPFARRAARAYDRMFGNRGRW